MSGEEASCVSTKADQPSRRTRPSSSVLPALSSPEPRPASQHGRSTSTSSQVNRSAAYMLRPRGDPRQYTWRCGTPTTTGVLRVTATTSYTPVCRARAGQGVPLQCQQSCHVRFVGQSAPPIVSAQRLHTLPSPHRGIGLELVHIVQLGRRKARDMGRAGESPRVAAPSSPSSGSGLSGSSTGALKVPLSRGTARGAAALAAGKEPPRWPSAATGSRTLHPTGGSVSQRPSSGGDIPPPPAAFPVATGVGNGGSRGAP